MLFRPSNSIIEISSVLVSAGMDQPVDLQHCDTRKGGQGSLSGTPANPAHHIETRVRYEDWMARSARMRRISMASSTTC